ncbi:hypothetical protein CC86DRAFT_460914 [Ophiobolus disseminans]|uniref:Uncharacterized protein n=1 Tax=Ophiobolus disseminans TaxID=1469910 RepID=A0A6A6ZDM0_9PLEO|nr:hypothetical protein CC86DRAFT_460914 [Ophiobolus disseminans]
MPPKKETPPKIEYRQLVREKGIRFEGPAPPRDWPTEFKRHFQVIRSIESTRYEDYRTDRSIPRSRRLEFCDRVRYFRNKVYDFLDDTSVNETTWRELEQKILERFDSFVICPRCKHELWKSDNEATLSDEQEQLELEGKRHARKMCNCGDKIETTIADDSDNEHGYIFDFAKDAAITHIPDDKFPKLRISMMPDRVIGLRVPLRVAHDESYFPVTGKRILLPFLVVEAKKEMDPPGFRAIQYQTAFPIRRLLSAQNEMYADEQRCEPGLVWFFAYQGEQWRLSAGIMKDSKVSQDGALQLLLIVDYIWSWARDVYRPTILRILLNSSTGSRDLSPASTDRFRQSVSLSCAPSAAPSMRNVNWSQFNETHRDIENSGSIHQESFHQPREDNDLQAAEELTNASFDPFLRWAVGHQHAPPWITVGSIRHSDIVDFEFRCYFVNRSDLARLQEAGDHETLWTLFVKALGISPERIKKIATLWTSRVPQVLPRDGMSMVPATFFFRTNWDPMTWQIIRSLNCIIWEMTDWPPSTETAEQQSLEDAVLGVRQIHGRDSVWYALQSTTVIYDTRNQWEKINGPKFNLDILGLTNLDSVTLQLVYSDNALLRVNRTVSNHTQSPDFGIERDTRSGNSMLAVRSPSWSQNCPKFCLFVLSDVTGDSAEHLHQLLEEAQSLENHYCEGNFKFTRADRQELHKWGDALKEQAQESLMEWI